MFAVFFKSFFKANKKRCWISAISDQLEVMRLEAYWQAAQLQSRNGENCNTFPRTWINMGDKIWSRCITCFFLRWLKKTFTYINYIRITRWVEWFSCLSCGSCLSSWSGFCCSCLDPLERPSEICRVSWISDAKILNVHLFSHQNHSKPNHLISIVLKDFIQHEVRSETAQMRVL